MKYSIIFLNYDPENTKEWIPETRRLIEEHSKNFDYELIEVKDVKGYVNAVNEGFKRATGDYFIVFNDDIYLNDDLWLLKLTADNAIVSWRKVPFFKNGDMYPDGSCWGLSRETQEKIGLMDTAYAEGYGCDEVDYFYTAKELGVGWESYDVHLTHAENKTYSSDYFKAQKEAMTERNVRIFHEKWQEILNLK